MKNLLQGKVAIVTEVASALGYASVKRFVEKCALLVEDAVDILVN